MQYKCLVILLKIGVILYFGKVENESGRELR